MGLNSPITTLDAAQIIQREFDIANDAQRVNIVTGTVTASNPSVGLNGSPVPTSSTEVAGKDDSGNLTPLHVDTSGNLNVLIKSSLVSLAYDEIVIAYVGATTDISSVTYKLATATITTLTFSYDGSSRLIDVVKT